MTDLQPVPVRIVQMVNEYLRTERSAVERFDNREPFDSSGVWSLRDLARAVYAAGWNDGYTASREEQQSEADQ